MEKIVEDFFLWKQSSENLKNYLNSKNDIEHQENILSKTVESEVNKKNPVDPQFCLSFVKSIIKILESEKLEVGDKMYDHIQTLQKQIADGIKDESVFRFFKSYFIEDEVVSLVETKQIISDGTTGLSSWTAGIQLSHFISYNQHLFANKSILELGSGTGITGIFCLKSLKLEKFTFTDCHTKVVDNLRWNAKHNLQDAVNYSVYNLDWEQFSNLDARQNSNENEPHYGAKKSFNQSPAFNIEESQKEFNEAREDCFQDVDDLKADFIIGADIVFDTRIIPDLVATIRILLSLQGVAIIASTVRNEETYQFFLEQLREHNLSWEDTNYVYKYEPTVKILKIQLTLL